MKSRTFLYVSLGVDIIIAASKFIAAMITGSSSMISEGIHSVIDAFSQLMLIWGVRSSRKSPDDERPFGYGRELYFWSFMVSLVIFILGGCISFYQGVLRLRRPEISGSPTLTYIILGIAFLFTCVSLYTALKEFNKQRGHTSFFKAVTESKDPPTFIVLLGDVGDLFGLVIAFGGVYLGRLFHSPYCDGGASMLIGIIMIVISLLLVRESKSLLMGEPTSKKNMRTIVALTEADEAVIKVKKHFSTYMGPEEVLMQLNTIFKPDLNTGQITDAIERISKNIQSQFPRIKQIFIEPVR
ncbi:cation diffusion facilitator family transporter [Mucilaginibacter paludis]|uniref:Cation diffusion facilitator family transporter n=1 Tax=Mucilaginibacter paludis DSM 18603 TaxID=714943 RepID=H1YGI7_9SPHI|nr:cation diffusion facilitator family transporter [Mucilaginibacter paludis]EHQ25373.1 cation diffusion facilitator family transporter [Mucilaginibacter paludis DSM 18603]